MKKYVKHVAKRWLLPPGVLDAGRALAACFRKTSQEDRRVIASAATNIRLKDRHVGRRCFILATGPSINTQDLSSLQGEICIGVSFFHLHHAVEVIRPQYHLLAPNHPPFDYSLSEKYHRTLLERYKWDVELLVGHYQFEHSHASYFFQHFANGLGFSCINYSASQDLDSDDASDNQWDLAGSPFRPRTVLYSAIQLAYYLGCREIVLLGCDHNYIDELGKESALHFYAEPDGNQWDNGHLAGFTSERWFLEYYRRWRDYRLMRLWLNSRGVIVRNATPGSRLDVFPICSLGEFLS